jgi:hypothetical protein
MMDLQPLAAAAAYFEPTSAPNGTKWLKNGRKWPQNGRKWTDSG